MYSEANYPSNDTLKYNTIRHSGAWENPNNNDIANNIGIGGLVLEGSLSAVINANNIYDNNGHDVINLVSKTIETTQDARYNYWGDSTTAQINLGGNPKNITMIHDEYDNSSLGFVNYAGHLDSINGTPSSMTVLADLELLDISGAIALNYSQ